MRALYSMFTFAFLLSGSSAFSDSPVRQPLDPLLLKPYPRKCVDRKTVWKVLPLRCQAGAQAIGYYHHNIGGGGGEARVACTLGPSPEPVRISGELCYRDCKNDYCNYYYLP